MDNFVITPRDTYIDQLLSLTDSKNLVIISGVRRSGKSHIAMQLECELQKKHSDRIHVIRISFERSLPAPLTADELIAQIKERYAPGKRNYLLFDEIIHVEDWERAVNDLCRLDNCKVILISSNRCVLSPRLQAIQDDKWDMIQVFPLSLKEFIQFHRFQETTNPSVSPDEKLYTHIDGKIYTIQDIYDDYITYGGLPLLKREHMESDQAWVISEGSYGAIVTRDILEIDSNGRYDTITDPLLLRNVIATMASSIGENISATWVGKQTSKQLGRSNATKTIQSYIQALLNAHMFYMAERFDIRSEQVLKTMSKYYVVDACILYYLSDIHVEKNRLLENDVYFELLRRGYSVYNGKIGKDQITFVAMKGDERIYIQVTDDMSPDSMDKLFSPFRKIRDNHTKMVIVRGTVAGTTLGVTYEGYVIMNALEFLMGNDFKL